MAINKVEFGGKTLIDISDSSVAKNNLLLGETAYGPDGERVIGSLTIGYYTPSVSQPQEDTMEIAFLPSVNDIPKVEPVELPLPTGPQGVGIKAITMEEVASAETNDKASELLIKILNAGTYTSDQADNISALAELLGIFTPTPTLLELPDVPQNN